MSEKKNKHDCGRNFTGRFRSYRLFSFTGYGREGGAGDYHGRNERKGNGRYTCRPA